MGLVSVRVDEAIEEKWKQEVEKSDEYSSLSHLVRRAVSREISDRYTVDGAAEKGVEIDLDVDIGEEMQEIKSMVEENQTLLHNIERESQYGKGVREMSEWIYRKIRDMTDGNDYLLIGNDKGMVPGMAPEIDADDYTFEAGLERLADQYEFIQIGEREDRPAIIF